MAVPDLISIEDFGRIDLRTATVVACEPHPRADRLLVLTVDVGDGRKQLVAGIRQHYAPETLVGKTVVVVNNLAPAVLRGVQSEGMLLAVSAGDRVHLLTPDGEVPAGTPVR